MKGDAVEASVELVAGYQAQEGRTRAARQGEGSARRAVQIQKQFLGQPPHMLRSAFHWTHDRGACLRFTSDGAVLSGSESPVAVLVHAIAECDLAAVQ